LLAGIVAISSGASLFVYRYFTRPVTLTVAVGSIGGELRKQRQPSPDDSSDGHEGSKLQDREWNQPLSATEIAESSRI